MAESELSRRRRAENEVIFRQRNVVVKNLARSVLDKDSRLDLSIKFVCECSDEDCHESIEIPVHEFEQTSHNTRQFIVKAGHQQSDLERVMDYEGYMVVEKFEEPPPTNGQLNRTK